MYINNIFKNIIITLRITRLYFIILFEIIKYFFVTLLTKFNNKKVKRLELIKSIVKKIENINVVYVKILQSLCIDKKILYKDEEEYLMKYLDDVPYNKKEIDNELLTTLKNNYNIQLDNQEPINSGIVSIVFKGKYNNKNVVIKVLKKNIKERLNNVFDELCIIVNILSYFPFIKEFNFNKILQSNKELLINQTDFIIESNNILIFYEKFKNNTEFVIPYVYQNITNEYNNVIVMDNIKGMHYKDIKNLDPIIKNQFGKLLFKFALLSTLFYNAIHCDLHAGNIFFYINDDDSNKPKYQLGLIDFGIVTFPSKINQDGYYKFFFELQLNKNYENIDAIILSAINEKNKYLNMNNDEKERLHKLFIDCVINYTFKEFDIKFFYEVSKILNSYNLYLTKEFDQMCLSIQIANNLGLNLCNNVIETQRELLNELNNINKLFEFN